MVSRMAVFSDVIGQSHIKQQLQGAISQGRVSHAYMICGENRSGKEFIAKIFAATLLCEKGGTDPCGQCASCKKAESMNHLDIIYVDHEKPGVIGVDDIRRSVSETISLRPYGKYKVYIMESAETMTVAAQNALLKTIEEPPEYAVFILLSSMSDAILPTILSRCVVLNMKPVSDQEMRGYLMKTLQVPEHTAEICIAFARGNVGRAKALASSEEFEKIRREALSLLKNIYDMDMAQIMDALKNIDAYDIDIKDYLDIMGVWYRDVLLFKATHDVNQLIFRDEIQAITKVAQRTDYEGIETVTNALETARKRLESNVSYDLTMELLLLTIKEN